MFSVACSAGFASCKTFGKQPKHPCFGRSPKRGEGGSPTLSPARMPGVYAQRLCTMQSQQSIHSPSPRGRGLEFRQGCRDRTPKDFARTQSPQSVLIGIENSLYLIKNRLFLQAVEPVRLFYPWLKSGHKAVKCGRAYIAADNSAAHDDKVHSDVIKRVSAVIGVIGYNICILYCVLALIQR